MIDASFFLLHTHFNTYLFGTSCRRHLSTAISTSGGGEGTKITDVSDKIETDDNEVDSAVKVI